MKYENPTLEVINFEKLDVIRTSLQIEGGGSGGDHDGPWGN